MAVQQSLALPPLPVLQFKRSDLDDPELPVVNVALNAIANRVNALSPTNPNIRLKVQAQFGVKRTDLDDPETFFNQKYSILVKNVNALVAASPKIKAKPVQQTQFTREDFEHPDLPVFNQALVSLVKALNSL